jgi:hypothetical protein
MVGRTGVSSLLTRLRDVVGSRVLCFASSCDGFSARRLVGQCVNVVGWDQGLALCSSIPSRCARVIGREMGERACPKYDFQDLSSRRS